MKQFLSDLRQNWDKRPFVWTEGEMVDGLKARLPSSARVLVLAPHPDDPDSAAITCRLLMRSGCNVSYAIVSMSPSGVEDEYARNFHDEGLISLVARKIAIRKREQIASARMLGLTEDRVAFLSFEEKDEGPLSQSPEKRAQINFLLESTEPDIVIMPVGRDENRTHAWVYQVFREQAEALTAKMRRPIAALYNEDPKTLTIETDLYVLFGEESARWKAALLRTHDSQQQRNMRVRQMGFDERILCVNRRRYARFHESANRNPSSVGYAEVFEIEIFGL